MKEDFVSFETAKLLKEKGFDWDCIMVYDLEKPKSCADGKLYDNFDNKNPNRFPDLCSAPSLAMAMKWLRKTHNLAISTSVTIDGWHSYVSQIKLDDEGFVVSIIDGIDDGNIPNCDTFEKSAEAALKYCLTNLI